MDSVPVMPLGPLQPPDATQFEELLADHVRFAEADFWTVPGATVSATIGGSGAGADVAGAGGEVSEDAPPQPISVAATSSGTARNKR